MELQSINSGKYFEAMPLVHECLLELSFEWLINSHSVNVFSKSPCAVFQFPGTSHFSMQFCLETDESLDADSMA